MTEAAASAPTMGQGQPGAAAPSQGKSQPSSGGGESPFGTASSKMDFGGDGGEKGTEGKAVPEPKEPPKKYKVKDGDDELEVDESELVRGYQRARAATKRFEEAAALRSQMEGVIKSLKSDTIGTLKRLGIDPRTLSEGYLKQVLEDEMLQQQDPRAYKLRKQQQELEREKAELAEWRKQKEQEKFDAQKRQAAARLEKLFIEAMESSKLPKSPFVVKRMAEYIKRSRA
jgi:hypothetical protein